MNRVSSISVDMVASARIYKIIGGSETTGPVTNTIEGVGSWKDVENGSNGNIESVVAVGDNIYVGGSFTTAGSIDANNIAVYNKTQGWEDISEWFKWKD